MSDQRRDHVVDFLMPTKRIIIGEGHEAIAQMSHNRMWSMCGMNNPCPVTPGLFAGWSNTQEVDGDSAVRSMGPLGFAIAYYESGLDTVGQFRVYRDGKWTQFSGNPYINVFSPPTSYGFLGDIGQRMAFHKSGLVVVADSYWTPDWDSAVSLWVSTDFGKTWLPEKVIYTGYSWGLCDISIDFNGDIYAVAGAYDVGWHVWKSTDKGKTYTTTDYANDPNEYTEDITIGVSNAEYVFATEVNPALNHNDTVVHFNTSSLTIDSYNWCPAVDCAGDTWCSIASGQKVTTQEVSYFTGGDGYYHAIDPFGTAEWHFHSGAWSVFSGTPVGAISGVPGSSPIIFTHKVDSTTIMRNGVIVWQGENLVVSAHPRQWDLHGDNKSKHWVAAPTMNSTGGTLGVGETVGILLSVDDGLTWNIVPVTGCVRGPTIGAYSPTTGINVDVAGAKVAVSKAETYISQPTASAKLEIFVGDISGSTVTNWKNILSESRAKGYAGGSPASCRIVVS